VVHADSQSQPGRSQSGGDAVEEKRQAQVELLVRVLRHRLTRLPMIGTTSRK
jgi:hypothetical protein